MRSLALQLLALPLAALSAGCTGNVASSEVADAEASAITAVVVVERTSGNQLNQAEFVHGEAVARFVRMRSGVVDDDALRMVGAAVDFPAIGSCTRVTSAGAPIVRAIDLVDVGSLSLEVDGARTNLLARRLPDVVDLVSGVVYTARVDVAGRGRYLFRAGGRPELDVAPFAVEASVMGEPGDLRVANQEPRAGEKLLIAGTGAVDVTWNAAPSADLAAGAQTGAEDLVYIDVAAAPARAGVTPSATTRCLFFDAGKATLAPAAFGDGDGTLTAHRLHRESFRARGIDAGEIRFDFARVISFRRR